MGATSKKLPIMFFTFVLIAVWTISFAILIYVSSDHLIKTTLEEARIAARVAFEKDVLFRAWAASHGGIYVPVTEKTPPNPYLKDMPDRDIVTTKGKKLTLINPAYMTRQVYELADEKGGSHLLGHLTSLKPIRPQNAPTPWERVALESFEKGGGEYSEVVYHGDIQYMMLMRPLFVEKQCLRCHARQGYKEGDIRGGISVGVPMEPLLNTHESEFNVLVARNAVMWGIGLLLMLGGARIMVRIEAGRIKANEDLERSYERSEAMVVERTAELKDVNDNLKEEINERIAIQYEREKLIEELKRSIEEIKVLKGLIPICAKCKKIRDDKGYWNQIEVYLEKHTDAEFTHGYCPDCVKKILEEDR